MFITYLKLLLNSLTSISKGYFNQEWPGSLCNLSAGPECTKWQSCPPVRAREGVDIGTIPKVCAGLKDDVSCPMRKHLLSAWSVGEQWVSITQTGSQERDIIPTAPLFIKSECSCKLPWRTPDIPFPLLKVFSLRQEIIQDWMIYIQLLFV